MDAVSIFPTPIMYAAWGTLPGGGGDKWAGVSGLAAYCKKYGFKTVCVEIGSIDRAGVKTLQDAGLFVVAWNVVDGTLADILFHPDTGLHPDGVHAQIEGPGQYDGALAGFESIKSSTIPKAVVTTYWGLFDPTNDTTIRSGSKWKALAALGCKEAWVETYASDGHANIDAMLFQGTVYGIPAAALFALCGTYRGELPPNYAGIEKQGRNFGCYLAEPMSETQWAAWGGVNKVTQVYYWQVIAKPTGQVLHEERAVTYAVGDSGLTRTLTWLGQNLPTIRTTNDVEIKRVLEDPH